MQQRIFSMKMQAHIFASGLLILLTLGTLAAVALCLAALWLLVQAAALLLTSTVEACSAIAATYTAADPLVKFFILASLATLAYRAGRRMLRRP